MKHMLYNEKGKLNIRLIVMTFIAIAAYVMFLEYIFKQQPSTLTISTDEGTGVQYIRDECGGLTPRLDRYGNLMVKDGYED